MEPLERAVAELQEQNYGSAIRTLEMLTARDPSNAEAYKHLAQAYFRTGQREQAAEAAQRYAALKPTDPQGHYNAGVILVQLGQAAAAERAFRAAISADPGYAKAHEALAKLAPSAEATAPLIAPPGQSAFSPTAAAPPAAALAGAGAAVPAVAAAAATRGPMPLQAKIAAAGTVVASVAILLWLFLPGGPANRGRPKVAPTPSPSGITTPPPTQPAGEQPSPATAEPTPAPSASEAPKAPETKAPAPQPAAGAGPTLQAGPLMTPQQAQAVAEDMNKAQEAEVAAAKAQIGQIAQAIRGLDEETWKEGGRDAIVLQTTQLLGTQASAGALGALKLVADAATPRAAADALEGYARALPPALSVPLVAEVSRALSTPGITPQQAYDYIKSLFQKQGIELLDQPEKRLRDALRLTALPGGGAGLPGM